MSSRGTDVFTVRAGKVATRRRTSSERVAVEDGSPLSLDAESMRQIGYRTIDMLVDRITGPEGPVVRSATPEELHQRISIPPPEEPVAFDEILAGLEADVLPFVARISHPGYLAFIPGEGTWPGALGDLIASALNVDTCWWVGSSGPSALELVVLDWFRQWVGYPEQAQGCSFPEARQQT